MANESRVIIRPTDQLGGAGPAAQPLASQFLGQRAMQSFRPDRRTHCRAVQYQAARAAGRFPGRGPAALSAAVSADQLVFCWSNDEAKYIMSSTNGRMRNDEEKLRNTAVSNKKINP